MKSTRNTERSNIIKLLKLTRMFYKENLKILILSLITLLFGFILPIINMKIVDEGILGKNYQILILMGACNITLLVLSRLNSFLAIHVTTKSNQKVAKYLTLKIMDFYIESKAENLGKNYSSKMDMLIKRDVSYVQRFILDIPQTLIINIISIIISIAMLVNFQPVFALLVLLIQTATVLIRLYFNKKLESFNFVNHKNYEETNTVLNEIIQYAPFLKLLNMKPYILKRYEKLLDISNAAQLKMSCLFQNLTSILSLFSEGISCIMLCIGGILIINGELTIGILMGCLTFISKYDQALSGIFDITTTFKNSKAEVSDIVSIFNDSCPTKTNLTNDIKKIYLDMVSFGYPLSESLLSNISMSFERGNIYYIIGESGIGKTTLMRLLIGELSQTSGKIFYNDIPASLFSKNEISEFLTFVPNEPIIINDNIMENLTLNEVHNKQHVIDICRDCEISADMLMSCQKDKVLEEHGYNLSAGQKQRISIARALLTARPIIIFDEMTANLDAITEAKIKKTLVKYSADKIIIIITHSKNFIIEKSIVLEIKDKHLCIS